MIRPVVGRIPDPPDSRDHPLSAHVPNLAAIVASLPAFHSAPSVPVLDQGQTSECVAYSGSLVRTISERKDEHRTLGWDEHALYQACKAIDDSPGDGTYIRAACQVLTSDGAKVTKSSVPVEIGQSRKIAAYARLTTLDEIKAAILTFGAAWLGSSWYNSWFTPVKGVLPAPDTVAGGHAYTAVGWNDSRQAFRCQNSWSKSYGQNGRFWLPYRFVDWNDFDCWRTLDLLGDVA